MFGLQGKFYAGAPTPPKNRNEEKKYIALNYTPSVPLLLEFYQKLITAKF